MYDANKCKMFLSKSWGYETCGNCANFKSKTHQLEQIENDINHMFKALSRKWNDERIPGLISAVEKAVKSLRYESIKWGLSQRIEKSYNHDLRDVPSSFDEVLKKRGHEDWIVK